MNRICNTCGNSRPIRMFRLRKNKCRKRTRVRICRACDVIRAKLWAEANQKRRKEIEADYRRRNPRKRHHRLYYLRNRKRIYQVHKAWRRRNPDKELNQVKRWQQKCRERLGAWYLKRLLRCGDKPISPKSIKSQAVKTRIHRSQSLLKTMATAAALKP